MCPRCVHCCVSLLLQKLANFPLTWFLTSPSVRYPYCPGFFHSPSHSSLHGPQGPQVKRLKFEIIIYILYIPLIKQVKDTILCVVSLLCTSQSILGRELSLVLWCRMNPPLASRFRRHPESKLTIDDYSRHWSACFFQLAAACCSLPVSPVRLWGLIQVVEGNLVRLNVWVPSWIAISPWAEAEAE